jgi:hypothetical protein
MERRLTIGTGREIADEDATSTCSESLMRAQCLRSQSNHLPHFASAAVNQKIDFTEILGRFEVVSLEL